MTDFAASRKQLRPMNSEFSLLCTSHGIALLDAITDWRDQWQSQSVDLPEHRANSQGWFNGAMPSEFAAKVIDPQVPFDRCSVLLLPGHVQMQVGPLATIDRQDPQRPVLQLHPLLTRTLGQWQNSELIISAIGGNEYLMQVFKTSPEYDFVHPGFPTTPGLPVLPRDVVDALMEKWTRSVVTTLIALRRMTTAKRIVQVLPPPPLEDIASMPYTEGFGDVIRQYGFVRDQLRLKWYQVYCEKVIEQAQRLDCEVILPPRASMTDSGLLLQTYAEGLTHGNQAYGALLAKQIFSIVE